jgi:hypothetical protein
MFMPFMICIIFLMVHAGVYFAVLRGWAALRSEKGIFLYHFMSAILVAGGFGVWAIVHGGSDAWTWFAAVVMLHGIYSLSFLELWALADDSYSLAVMEIIDRGSTAPGPALMQRLEAIGTRKQTSRLDALQGIKLVHELGDGSFTLTLGGRAAVVFGRTLFFLVNVRKHG